MTIYEKIRRNELIEANNRKVSKLGEGGWRSVWSTEKSDRVIKICNGYSGQDTNALGEGFLVSAVMQSPNLKEYLLWKYTMDYPVNHVYKQWLAPCIELSDGGTWLEMVRTQPIDIDDLPKIRSIPAILAHDLQIGNFGIYEGRVVLHDYHSVYDSIFGRHTDNPISAMRGYPKKHVELNWERLIAKMRAEKLQMK